MTALTIPEFTAIKKTGRKISMLTAYDFPTARLVDEAGIDAILVGDSLGMVVQGKANTLPVTLEEMIYHTEIVARAACRALVIADLPFPGGHDSWVGTLRDCTQIMKRTNCHGVKMETSFQQKEMIARMVDAGIPILAHIGLLPQKIQTLGTYSIQRVRDELMRDALAVQDAGAFGVVLECVEHGIAREISAELSIPTIGIGSGPYCDGQILVLQDILGLSGRTPKHAKQYVDLNAQILAACFAYRKDVEGGNFPKK
ncbi:MAG: 3-methyl-2-oxobutanoate hydroxymethyltransferase [Thermoguttaceae bacterium]|nr:3-methyl-2-oxobutanoate hydroxymethyltransferase [Thermoguttaceae bacterium]